MTDRITNKFQQDNLSYMLNFWAQQTVAPGSLAPESKTLTIVPYCSLHLLGLTCWTGTVDEKDLTVSFDQGNVWLFWLFVRTAPGFPTFQENKIPWFLPGEVSKFHDNYFNLFSVSCVFYVVAVNHLQCKKLECKTISLGQSKFPDFSLTEKSKNHFSWFPWWAGNPVHHMGIMEEQCWTLNDLPTQVKLGIKAQKKAPP